MTGTGLKSKGLYEIILPTVSTKHLKKQTEQAHTDRNQTKPAEKDNEKQLSRRVKIMMQEILFMNETCQVYKVVGTI